MQKGWMDFFGTEVRTKALAFGLMGVFPVGAYAGTVAVTTGTQYQVIQGFGASSYAESISNAEATSFFTDQSNLSLGTQNGNSIGLSIMRLSIDEGGNFGTEGNDAKLGIGANSNLEVFASEWSPPAADKNDNSVNGPGSTAANTNTNFNPPTGNGTNTPITADLGNYATFQAGFAQTMKATYGVNLYAISPQNEPDWNTTYDSCLWSPAQFDTYVPLLAAALKTAGMSSVKIMMPESFADNLTGSNQTMADANAAPDVSIIGMHLYGGGPNAIPASYSTVAGHPVQGWCTEISEHSGSGTPFSDTLYYAQQIHKCIVDTGFNAYCYWWLVNLNADDEGLYTSGAQPTSTYYMMGNWAKFIRPGFVRVSCTENPQTNVQVSAYTGTATENGAKVTRCVIVAINGGSGSVSQTFNYTDQNVTQTYPWITSSSDNFTSQAAVSVSGGQFTYTLPASSITTFVADCGSQGSPTDTPSVSPTFSPSPSATVSPTETVTPSPIPTAGACQYVAGVDCGATAAYTSTQLGQTFGADQQYVPTAAYGTAGSYGYVSWSAGTAYTSTATITGWDSADATLYNTQRYGATLGYDFNVPNGQAYVTFYWAETYATAVGQRVFSVTINGTTVEAAMDLYATAGADNTYRVTFPVTVTGGVISIVGTGNTNNAEFQAISVQAGPSCTASPTRSPSWTPSPSVTVTRTSSFTATSTVSPTQTRTFSPTALSTASPTSTVTLAMVPSFTVSPANSSTKTQTGTTTFTVSPVDSSTKTQTGTTTFTISPVNSSTKTPTETTTFTASPVDSATATPTVTTTFTASPVDSATATPTVTVTVTVTASSSPTASPVDTFTDTVTVTSTPTFSPDHTATATLTPSSSVTATPSFTATVTPSIQAAAGIVVPSALSGPSTGGFAVSVSTTGISSNTLYVDFIGTTITATVTVTSSPGSGGVTLLNGTLPPLPSSLTATGVEIYVVPTSGGAKLLAGTITLKSPPTSTVGGGPLVIQTVYGVPNPNPHTLAVDLGGPADSVAVKVLTKALVVTMEFQSGPLSQGWNSVLVPALNQLPNGLYYALVQAHRGGSVSPIRLVRIMILH